jgi:regulator of RNase E activity RraA
MRKQISLLALILVSLGFSVCGWAQIGMFTKEQRLELTREWKGERFEDGRPKVSDELLKRMATVDAEEAWGVLMGHGFINQFEGHWHIINPGPRLAARVVTAVFMPVRPDVNAVIAEHGKAEHRVGAQNSWIIDILQPGDILVADLFGKVKDGTLIGDNLGTSIYTKSHTGLIVDGAVRDESGISEIEGFRVYTRDVDPSALRNVMLMGINVPIRIGQATVMPGDIAVTDVEGVTFVPPQLCEEVADHAETIHMVDEWGHLMLRQQKYNPGQIDGKWTHQMNEEFNQYCAAKGSKVRRKDD